MTCRSEEKRKVVEGEAMAYERFSPKTEKTSQIIINKATTVRYYCDHFGRPRPHMGPKY